MTDGARDPHRPAARSWRRAGTAIAARLCVDGPRLAFFAIASLALALGARYLGNTSIPLLPIELILLAPFLRTRIGLALMLVSVITASARVVQGLFGFDQLFISIPLLVHNLFAFPSRYTLQLAAMLIAYLGGIALVLRLLPARTRRVGPWMAVAAMALLVGAKSAEDSIKQNLVGTQFGYLSGQFRFAGMFEKGYAVPGGPVVGHPAVDASAAAVSGRLNLWLVVVESLGLPADPALRQALLAPMLDNPALRQRYDIQGGQLPSVGSTIHGELRALCNGHLNHGLFAAGDTDCLPARMAAAGYRTRAVHANASGVYGRNVWYRNIGFQQISASDTEPALAGERSGRWGTRVDGDTIEWTRLHAFGDPGPHFTYLLTVSTHLPAEVLPGATPLPDCLAKATAHACEHLANLRLVLSQLADAAARQEHTVLVLIGDHPPPFVSPGSRSAFSATDVPWVRLTPKQSPSPP